MWQVFTEVSISSIIVTIILSLHHYIPTDLCKRLLTCGIQSCGTVRINRVGIPKPFKDEKLKKGDVVSFQDGTLTGIRWMDKRPVAALSTIHDASVTTVSRRSRLAPGGIESISKPVMIVEYNKYMGGVDVADQLVTYYGFNHCSKKWWKRVFFHLLEVSLVNSYIIYSSSNPLHKLTHLDYVIAVASGVLEKTGLQQEASEAATSNQPMRLVGRDHFPEPSGRKGDCVVCSSRRAHRKQSSYRCNTCRVSICIHPCFRKYHMLKKYK